MRLRQQMRQSLLRAHTFAIAIAIAYPNYNYQVFQFRWLLP